MEWKATEAALTEWEAATLVIPEVLEGLRWQEYRLEVALRTLHGNDPPADWAQGLSLLRQARRKMLHALVENES